MLIINIRSSFHLWWKENLLSKSLKILWKWLQVYQKHLSDNQETRRPKETQFSLEKKYSIKRKMDSQWTPRNVTFLDGSCYEAMESLISQNIFSYLKIFSTQCRKNIIVEDNKKRMNTQNKNDSINSILQHGHAVEKNCCVVFPASRSPYLILCPR